jgi:hypothetical protein
VGFSFKVAPGGRGCLLAVGALLLLPLLFAAALLILPIAGAGWGMAVLGTWLVNRGTERAPSGARTAVAAGVAAVSVVVAATTWPAMLEHDKPRTSATGAVTPTGTPSATPTPTQQPTGVSVPDVVGKLLPEARKAIFAASLREVVTDRSPRGRGPLSDSNWTVVATEPAAGTQAPKGRKVTLFVLKNSEAAWFTAHPVMPQLSQGNPTDTLTSNGGQLFGISELVEVRYANGAAPADARDPDETAGRMNWRGVEPAEETRARAGLKQALNFGTVVVGSIPAAGLAVRTGRLIVVTVKDAPHEPAPTPESGDVYIPPMPNGDDDDDVNVPGWLCPTRFC